MTTRIRLRGRSRPGRLALCPRPIPATVYASGPAAGALRACLYPEASAPGTAPREPWVGIVDPADFGLTARQAEVLGLMARGKSNRQIAELLCEFFSEVPPNVVYFLTPVGEKLSTILNEMFIGKLIMSHYMVQ